MQQARTISFFMMVTRLPCIAYKLVSLKTSTMKYSAASWRARTAMLCICRSLFPNFSPILRTRCWKGAFLMRRSVFFWTFGSPLEPPFLGASGEAFSWQSPFARPLVQPLLLNDSVRLLPQYIYGPFVWYGPWLVIFMVAGVIFKHAQVVTSLLCV